MLLILLLLLITDLFFYKGIRHLLNHRLTEKQKKVFTLLFWAHSVGFLAGTLLVSRWMQNDYDPVVQRWIYCFVGLFLAFYLPKILFIPFNFSEDIIRYSSMLINWFVRKKKTEEVNNNLKITRITFLTKAGLILAAIWIINLWNDFGKIQFPGKKN